MTPVDPALLDLPLTLRSIGENDYLVMAGEREVGRIHHPYVANSQRRWHWVLTRPYLPPHLQPSDGYTDTLPEAKLGFRRKFDAWRSYVVTHPDKNHHWVC